MPFGGFLGFSQGAAGLVKRAWEIPGIFGAFLIVFREMQIPGILTLSNPKPLNP